MEYIYARVSTNEQESQKQVELLVQKYPNAVIFQETCSGMKERKVLAALLVLAQKGDSLIVAGLDRLGRKTSEILPLIEDLDRRGVRLISVRENLDYGTLSGKLVTTIMVAVSELERGLISQRTKAALEALKLRGVKLGRPLRILPAQIEEVKTLRASGMNYRDIKLKTGISLSKLSAILAA